MKKKKLLSVIAVILSVFSIIPSALTKSYAEESYYKSKDECIKGYVEVETGSLFDYYDWIIYPAIYDHEYDVYVKEDSGVLGHFIVLQPKTEQAEFVISESVDLEKAWSIITPIVIKYNFNSLLPSDTQKYRHGTVYKADNQTLEEFVKETEDFMEELKNTGYVTEFYPPGSVNFVYRFIGDVECLGTADSEKREALIEYININLPDYSFVDGNLGNTIKLIPPENITIQERFDVVQQLYENCGAMPIFSGDDIDYVDIGNSIKLEVDPSLTTPAETTPIETTTITVSTTVTTESATEPAETTTSTVISIMTALPTATTATSTSTTSTTVPVETTVSETLDTTLTTITTTITTTSQQKLLGDADGDNELTVRDCSFIALTIAQGRNDELSESADFNSDGEVNVRDAAAIAKSLAQLKS